MTRTLAGATLALGLLVGSGQLPAMAGGVLIETTAPLADRSEESVKTAVIAAIDKAVRGASAMGFAWVQLRDARVSGNQVAVQILATDEDPGQAGQIAPGTEPDDIDDAPDVTEEPGLERPTSEIPAAADLRREARQGGGGSSTASGLRMTP
jgi:hypothetical protein